MKTTTQQHVLNAKYGNFQNDTGENVNFANMMCMGDKIPSTDGKAKGNDVMKIVCEEAVFHLLPDLPATVTLTGSIRPFQGKNQFVATGIERSASSAASK